MNTSTSKGRSRDPWKLVAAELFFVAWVVIVNILYYAQFKALVLRHLGQVISPMTLLPALESLFIVFAFACVAASIWHANADLVLAFRSKTDWSRTLFGAGLFFALFRKSSRIFTFAIWISESRRW